MEFGRVAYNPPSKKKTMTKAFWVTVIFSVNTCGIGKRTKTKSATIFGIEVPKKKLFKLMHLTPGWAWATGSQIASTGLHCRIAVMI